MGGLQFSGIRRIAVDLQGACRLAGRMKPLATVVVSLGILCSLGGCMEGQHQKKETTMIEAPTDVGGVPADAESSASGLAWKVLQEGDGGETPERTSTVTVHYTGWTTDGRMFDSSVARGEKISFPLNQVIAGWTEGVSMMSVGEKRRFWIPAKLAYGEAPPPGAPRGMLVFDVELFEIH